MEYSYCFQMVAKEPIFTYRHFNFSEKFIFFFNYSKKLKTTFSKLLFNQMQLKSEDHEYTNISVNVQMFAGLLRKRWKGKINFPTPFPLKKISFMIIQSKNNETILFSFVFFQQKQSNYYLGSYKNLSTRILRR